MTRFYNAIIQLQWTESLQQLLVKTSQNDSFMIHFPLKSTMCKTLTNTWNLSMCQYKAKQLFYQHTHIRHTLPEASTMTQAYYEMSEKITAMSSLTSHQPEEF